MSKVQTIKYWKNGFEKSGVKHQVAANYLEYIEILLDNEVPIIFDFEHLCLLLGRNRGYLASVVNASTSHYRVFEISKRSGGVRVIKSPYPALLECQKWIYKNILLKVKIHPAAHGFTNKKSIITNAKIHLSQNSFLKIDLKDFFPSITINKVITVFRSLGYTHKVSFYLASICCVDGVLPQGAPTSPVLSNIISTTLDKKLMGFAKKYHLKYSRYADDIAISGDEIPVKFIDYITKIIKSCDFEVNTKKTILQQKSNLQRIVTGISISEDKIKIPREYKRDLKQEIHYIRKYGILSHVRKKKIRKVDYLLTIIGKIRFWVNVEPDNPFAVEALAYFTNKQLDS